MSDKKDPRVAGWEEHIDAKKQHQVDHKISELSLKLDASENRYQELLTAHEKLKTEVEEYNFIKDRGYQFAPLEPLQFSDKHETTAVLGVGDWHIGGEITLANSGGVNVFNDKVDDRRISVLGRTAISLIDIWRSKANIDTLLMAGYGDYCSGVIHPELRETNYLPIGGQQIKVRKHFNTLIKHALKHGRFKRIIVDLVPGNHDRITEKVQIGNFVEQSNMLSVASILKEDWEGKHGNTMVEVRYAGAMDMEQRIYDQDYLITHGYFWKYKRGIGGPLVSINQWMKGIPERIRMVFGGHIHTSIIDRRVRVGGSLCGYSPLARAIGCIPEPPSQPLTIIDKKLGPVVSMDVFLD